MGISLSENKLLDLWKTTAKAVSEGVFINEEQVRALKTIRCHSSSSLMMLTRDQWVLFHHFVGTLLGLDWITLFHVDKKYRQYL